MSDILIRGMEMPKERSLWLCIKTDGTVYNIKPGGIGTAHAVGTVIPLPKGHGKIIDADVLMEIIRAHDYPLTAHFNITDNGMFTTGIQQAVDEAYKMFHAELMDG